MTSSPLSTLRLERARWWIALFAAAAGGLISAPAMLAADPIDLAAPGDAAIAIDGALAGDRTGFNVAIAGDVNGDGWQDALIGASQASPAGREKAGAAYLILGPITSPLDLAALSGRGIRIQGAAAGDAAGASVAGAGDMDGDGLDDIAIGAPSAAPMGRTLAGSVYVIFGRTQPVDVDLAALGSAGIRIDGATALDNTGDVAGARDPNLDGRDDLLIGAPGFDAPGRGNAGRVSLIFGAAERQSLDLAALPATRGIHIVGAASLDQLGHVSSAGDANGDGRADLLLGAPGADPLGRASAGRGYVVFGTGSPVAVDLAALGTAGYAIDGEGASFGTGSVIADAGDVDGDGRDDVILGSTVPDSFAGAAWVVFGKANALPVDLAQVDDGTGFRLAGAPGDAAGIAVSAAGDVNGDGRADLAVGAYLTDAQGRSNAGRVYVVPGRAASTPVALAAAAASLIRIDGPTPSGTLGFAIAGGADLDGDGLPDMLIGSGNLSPQGRSLAGGAYVTRTSRPTFMSQPSILGSLHVGVTVTCDPGPVRGVPAPEVVHGWLREGVVIPEAAGPTYRILALDAGSVLQCGVRATNALGTEVAFTYARSARVSFDLLAPTATAPKPAFVTGHQLGTSLVPVKLAWSGADEGSGIGRYELAVSRNGGAWIPISNSLPDAAYLASLSPTGTYRFRVRAVDRSGNAGAWKPGTAFRVRAIQESASALRYAGTWRTATSESASGGHTRHARATGARVTYTFTGRAIAVVMPKGSAKGRVAVFVNGSKVATLDLGAASSQPRLIVFRRAWSSVATRTISLRVLGSPASRPRIDLDAFVILR